MTVNVRTVDSVQYENRMRSFDFDIITTVWGQSLSPGNEQRDFFGSQAADRPGSRNCRRHQESGGRCPDRTHHLCQETAPNWSRPARRWTASCCGISMSCRNSPIGYRALCALGSLQPSRSAAEIWHFRISRHVVVGRRQGSQDRKAQLKEQSHGAPQSPARAGSRRRRAERRRARGRAAAASKAGTETHGMSVFGDLKYPADFKHFDYVNPDAPKGGLFSTIPSTARLQSVILHLQFVQRLHPQGRGRARAWT